MISVPRFCPSCATALAWIVRDEDGGEKSRLRCSACDAHAAGRNIVDVEHRRCGCARLALGGALQVGVAGRHCDRFAHFGLRQRIGRGRGSADRNTSSFPLVADRAQAIVERFRTHDEVMMLEQYKVRTDENMYVSVANQGQAQLNQVMAQDTQQSFIKPISESSTR